MTATRLLLQHHVGTNSAVNHLLKRSSAICAAGNQVNLSTNKVSALGNIHTSNMATSAKLKKLVTVENMNPNIIKMEYAVRGPLVTRALEIEKEIKQVSFFFNCTIDFFLMCSNCTNHC